MTMSVSRGVSRMYSSSGLSMFRFKARFVQLPLSLVLVLAISVGNLIPEKT